MNILFLTLSKISSLNEPMIYTDLLREFVKNGHDIYAITPIENRDNKYNYIESTEYFHLLHVNIGNYFNTNIVVKGITLITLEHAYISAINKQYNGIKFNLVLYSTPPISFNRVVSYIKRRDNAKSYLMLKDIFPQNALDIGMLSKHGARGYIYRYLRKKEKNLYAVSDYIGCMSNANIEYILRHNPEVSKDKVHICPNAISPKDRSISEKDRLRIRIQYNIPINKLVFIYGGNLGKPQGINFLMKCLNEMKNRDNCFFLIVGGGTEYKRLNTYIEEINLNNVKLINSLPKYDYDMLLSACDIGMIFLDYRFTIPNFPSRLLSYMQAKLPIIACTDSNTDIGKIIIEGGFGWWCESNNIERYLNIIDEVVKCDLKSMGEKGYHYLLEYFTVERAYNIIMSNTEIT